MPRPCLLAWTHTTSAWLPPCAVLPCAVFHARMLDDLMIASYCNNGSDRIVLQLLQRWHMGWTGGQAFPNGQHDAQQPQERSKNAGHLASGQQSGGQQQRQRGSAAARADIEEGWGEDGASEQQPLAQGHMQQKQKTGGIASGNQAAAGSSQASKLGGDGGLARLHAKDAVYKGMPTLLQVRA